MRPSPDGIEIVSSIPELVGYAYTTRAEFVFGVPKSASDTVYDVKLKVDEADIQLLSTLTLEQKGAMLAPVLVSRFGLKTHPEMRVLPVYDLILAKKGLLGPDFAIHSDKKASASLALSGENFSGTAVDMPLFTKVLSHVLADTIGRPIVDKTGLSGFYDFSLRWRPIDSPAELISTRPDIFTALTEQLGLRLQPTKESVSTIVVDSVELPSEN